MAKRGRPLLGTVPQIDDRLELFALWNRALETPNGIIIESAKPQLLMAKLYTARRESGLNIYNHLKLVTIETEVWIVPR